MKDLIEKSIKYNKDPNFILDKLSNLSISNYTKILNRFSKGKIKSNFISTLAELKFISELQKFPNKIIYDKEFRIDSELFTPDITINVDDSFILGDVYRLGKSEFDEKTVNRLDEIYDFLNNIQSNNVIRINSDMDNSSDFIDLDSYKDKLVEWLQNENSVDEFKINNQISFDKIGKHNSLFTQVCYHNDIDFKSGKLFQKSYQSKNEITKKYSKYKRLVIENNAPFFLFIEVDFLSGFTLDEFKEKFLFSSAEFSLNEYIKYQNYITDSGLGQTWSELGDFYIYPFLSGVLILYNNQFHLLLSPLKNQIIYDKKFDTFLSRMKEQYVLIDK